MADLATLSLALTNAQAIADAQATGAAFEAMGAKGEAAAGRIAASSNPVTAAIRQQAIDYTALTARTQDFARAGATAAQIQQMTGSSLAQAMAAIKAYSGTIAKAEIDVGGLRAAQAQMAMVNIVPGIERTTDATRKMTLMQMEAIAMNEKMGGGFNMAGAGLGRMRQSFASAIAMMTGISPIAGRIASTLGVMAVGVGEVVLGMAAIGTVIWVWDKLTDSIRKAAEEQDKMVLKLDAALLTHVHGAGGDLGEMITAGYGRLSDIAAEKVSKGSAMGALRSGDLQSYNLNPADRAVQLQNLDKEAGLLHAAIKSAETDLQLAKAKEFARSVLTPYDRAISRGTSISGFYSQALASEAELTKLAKSGTFEVRDAAISALGAMDKIITHAKLIKMGLATGPHQISGIESNAYLARARTETGDLLAGIMSAALHGADVGSFAGQISKLGGTLDKARPTDLADITALAKLRDDILLLGDAARMADAKTPADQESIASAIRTRRGFTSMAGPLVAAEAQRSYGDLLAAREAAIKLPAVFDAVRESALNLAEGLRTSHQKLAGIRSSWSRRQIGAGVEAGAMEGLATSLQSFTPQGITTALVTTGINYIISGFTDMVSTMIGGAAKAREFALQMQTMKDSLNAAVAAFQHNDLAAAYAQVSSQQDALIKQAWDTYGTATYIILHGTKDLTDALAKIAVGAQVSAEVIAQHARYAQEDLAVRNMRATGNVAGADLLAFREKQQREMDAAKISHASNSVADALYLNTLQTVQNNELLAYQNGLLSTALRNAPTGFYGSAFYAGPYTTPRTGFDPGTKRRSSAPVFIFHPGALQVDGQGVVSAVISRIDQKAAGTSGAGSSRAAALELM